jgi:hypothetical protein
VIAVVVHEWMIPVAGEEGVDAAIEVNYRSGTKG